MKLQTADQFNERFKAKCCELVTLREAKGHDYAGSDQQIPRDQLASYRLTAQLGVGTCVTNMYCRICEKIARFGVFLKQDTLKNESAEDTLKDMAVIAILMWLELEDEASGDGGPATLIGAAGIRGFDDEQPV